MFNNEIRKVLTDLICELRRSFWMIINLYFNVISAIDSLARAHWPDFVVSNAPFRGGLFKRSA